MTKFGTTFIILGITGDLASKKILPALYNLYVSGRLENTRVVGFSRRPFTNDEIKAFIIPLLPDGFNRGFLDVVTYVGGQFDEQKSYENLSSHLHDLDKTHLGGCSNKLYYLSVPPTLYEMIASNLSSAGLMLPCGGSEGFARLLIEKPFGNDIETAKNLDLMLGRLFREEQIFRIDHYLAKESLRKIINLHRRDPALQNKWTKDHISSVEINIFEKATVGSRGAFYDPVGALRDVGQNHMLQMLALVAAQLPEKEDDESFGITIQKARAEVLEKLVIPDRKTVASYIKGQYEGYLSEPGVLPQSNTETFFRITASLETENFQGVPFKLSAGKALEQNISEIVVHFKSGMDVAFSVPPEDSMPAYQKILLDCIAGDQTVFVSTDEVLAEWKFITPVVQLWADRKPATYPQGSDPEVTPQLEWLPTSDKLQ